MFNSMSGYLATNFGYVAPEIINMQPPNDMPDPEPSDSPLKTTKKGNKPKHPKKQKEPKAKTTKKATTRKPSKEPKSKVQTSSSVLKYLQDVELAPDYGLPIETNSKKQTSSQSLSTFTVEKDQSFEDFSFPTKKPDYNLNEPSTSDITPIKKPSNFMKASPSDFQMDNSQMNFQQPTIPRPETQIGGFMPASSLVSMNPQQRGQAMGPQKPEYKKNANPQQLRGINFEYANLAHWTNTNFPWTEKLLPAMEQFFGYRVFRANQKAIINATLAKRDCFVCMPTGGGKSLTFQIPAIVDRGVTLVIMPLLALIHDQVTQMEQKSIEVINLSSWGGQVNWSDYKTLLDIYKAKRRVMDTWQVTEPMPYPKIIFTTPERLTRSGNLMNFLKQLHDINMLDRIVIDEAHCVSHWGHDFREDYLKLKVLREEFPDVCILALTATAPEAVRTDVINSLKMHKTIYFQNSFNRPNLIFEVRGKTKTFLEEITKFITSTYPKKSGIIYAATIKEAEKITEDLKKKYHLKVECYHASLSDKERNRIHNNWLNDEIHVVVATIAFGMGINKLDVRFVIHTTFSKNISQYYQEAGRAGRDGLKSHCIIYYRDSDKSIHEFFLSQSEKRHKEKQEELIQMIKYCEEEFECRRVIQLKYFNEDFKKENCNKTCDNCIASRVPNEKDVTAEGKLIGEYVFAHRDFSPTILQLVDYLHSGKEKGQKKIVGNVQGPLKQMRKDHIERIVKQMLFQGILREELTKVTLSSRQVFCSRVYIDAMKFDRLQSGQIKLFIRLPTVMRPEKSKSSDSMDIQNEGQEKPIKTHPTSNMMDPPKPERIYYRIKDDRHQSTISHALNNVSELGKFSFKKDDLKPHLPVMNSKKYVYSKQFGFCSEAQFEELLDRLKLIRKRLTTSLPQDEDGKATNPDIIMPIEGLYEFCRKLPTSREELNIENIKNVSAKQLKEHGERFLREIEHFMKIEQIDKNDYYIPKEVTEESEQKEIFDIQQHRAEADYDVELSRIQNDEWSKPEPNPNPEIQFNILDFEDYNQEKVRELLRASQENKNLVGFVNDDDFNEDDLDMIDELLMEDKKKSEEITPEKEFQSQKIDIAPQFVVKPYTPKMPIRSESMPDKMAPKTAIQNPINQPDFLKKYSYNNDSNKRSSPKQNKPPLEKKRSYFQSSIYMPIKEEDSRKIEESPLPSIENHPWLKKEEQKEKKVPGFFELMKQNDEANLKRSRAEDDNLERTSNKLRQMKFL